MGFTGTDETAAASGVRAAVDFYSRKGDRLKQRQRELEAELTAFQAELLKTRAARDQLADALDEMLAQVPGAAEEPESEPETAVTSDAPSSAEPASAESTAKTAEDRQGPKPGKPKSARTGEKPSAKSGEVMRAIDSCWPPRGSRCT